MKGFIVTRSKKVISGKTTYIYSGRGENGPFEILINNKPPLFFIDQNTVLPPNIHYLYRKNVHLKSLKSQEVDALYFNSHNDLYNTKKVLKNLNLKCYESDVSPEERYLMERFIYGSIFIEGEAKKVDGILYYYNPNITPIEYIPDFKVLSLDIETGQDMSVYSIGLHFTYKEKEYKKVLMRSDSESIIGNFDYITYIPKENELLKEFLQEIRRMDPDIILGWHVIGFDLEFLRVRFEHYKIPYRLGRDSSFPLIRHIQNRSWICDINGRSVIDGPPTLRGAFYNFESFKLEYVAKEVLGIGKDIGDSGKVEEIERRFREDKEALAFYNLKDCTLVTDIFKKLDLINLTLTRAITSGMALDRIGMSVASFDYFMLPKIHRKGWVAPDVDDIEFLGQGNGGFVFSETPGFYDSVIVLDFKSLYPSIIRTFKIDPISRLMAKDGDISTPTGITFSREHNLLPDFIESLMNKRERAKQENKEHLSQAIKILMNSFYGVMGTPGSRFYHPDLPKAITGTGQWLLKTTREYLNTLGYQVIYGDTDSLFVQLKPEDKNKHDIAGNNLVDTINKYLKNLLTDKYSIVSELEIEYEKHFRKFFLPSLRGGKEGAKKRYAGLKTTKDGEELSFTGLEIVRSDWTELSKDFQYELFRKVFNEEEVEEYIRDVVSNLKKGILDKKLIYKKRLTKPASEYIKNIPPQVKAALKLDPEGKTRGYIKYVITTDGPEPIQNIKNKINYEHYIDKQLKAIADSILPFIDKDFETIVFSKQPLLF